MIKRQRIFITGRVQGVGFRPAVHRVARALGRAGYVYNDAKGVTIELQGQEENISQFLVRLKGGDKPPAARIKSCQAMDIAVVEGQSEFVIRESESAGTALAQVTADMAVWSVFKTISGE